MTGLILKVRLQLGEQSVLRSGIRPVFWSLACQRLDFLTKNDHRKNPSWSSPVLGKLKKHGMYVKPHSKCTCAEHSRDFSDLVK